MESTEKIIAYILQEAEEKAAQLWQEAKEKAEKEAAEMLKKAQEKARGLMENAKAEGLAKRQSALAVAALEGRKHRLAVCQALMDEVFKAVEQDLCALSKDEYFAFLGRLLKQCALPGEQEIFFNKRDKERCTPEDFAMLQQCAIEKEPTAQLMLGEKTANIAGGFLLSGPTMEVNAAIHDIINLRRAELEPLAYQLLFH